MLKPHSLILASATLIVSMIILATKSTADNWPQWRGPTGDGISQESNLPTTWSKQENIVWRLPLPGPAGSTPSVWEDRIFLTSVDDSGALLLICVGTDGKEVWRQTMAMGNTDVRGDEGNSASNSPCTDGEHVWAMMANGTIGCYTMAGEKVWKLNVADRYGKLSIQFGLTSTPVLDNGRLYLQLIHGEGKAETEEAAVVCLDAKTGDQIWKQKRSTGASQENEHAYSSPTIYRDGTREFLVTHGGDYAMAHQLSDGAELWRYCLNPQGASYHPTLRFVSSPLATKGLVIVPSAKNGPIVAIRGDASGIVAEQGKSVVWRHEKGTPDVPSPLSHGGLVYLCRENGILVCVDEQTGEKVYEERLVSDRHRASPVLAGEHLYLTARKGTISVVRTGRDFKLVAQNELGEPTSASPIIANGKIYVRTFEALYAIGK